jgi:hypothetical protein
MALQSLDYLSTPQNRTLIECDAPGCTAQRVFRGMSYPAVMQALPATGWTLDYDEQREAFFCPAHKGERLRDPEDDEDEEDDDGTD